MMNIIQVVHGLEYTTCRVAYTRTFCIAIFLVSRTLSFVPLLFFSCFSIHSPRSSCAPTWFHSVVVDFLTWIHKFCRTPTFLSQPDHNLSIKAGLISFSPPVLGRNPNIACSFRDPQTLFLVAWQLITGRPSQI